MDLLVMSRTVAWYMVFEVTVADDHSTASVRESGDREAAISGAPTRQHEPRRCATDPATTLLALRRAHRYIPTDPASACHQVGCDRDKVRDALRGASRPNRQRTTADAPPPPPQR